MSVCMFMRMLVHSINLPTLQIVWKLKVDVFTCKKRRSRPKIVDLAEIGHFSPIMYVNMCVRMYVCNF